ncbi:MAG: M1 family metallopeptidase [Acidimicrobiia bacterium]|nr:M1 family metallopeptidase [Acidimicrobiia bacterium]
MPPRAVALAFVVACSSLINAQQGTPSPRNASYTIEARLLPEARSIRGREVIRWRNTSSRPTSELQFHLYWNAWRNADSTWLRERRLAGLYTEPRPDAWSATDVTRLRLRAGFGGAGAWADLTEQQRFIAPDDGNAADRTVMSVALPAAVAPNESVDVEIEWISKIPRPFARTGYVDDYYFIAQWFPKLGVLEDAGWNTHQFHAATEFYSNFGVYDVALTVPAEFVVGASGRETARRTNDDGTVTREFHGEDIHDFAWTASPDYIDLTRRFEHATLPPVDVRLLLQPERRGLAERYFAISNATLRLYGEWFGAYPYGHMTVVDPAFQSGADGMEYPTLLTGRGRWLAPADVQVPEMTTSHEIGHQWWYGLVATNEFEHAWMDEGINTYATARVMDEAFPGNRVEARYFGGFIPWVFDEIPFTRIENDRLAGYRDNAEADIPATPTLRYWPSTATFISYNKTALWLHTLEKHLGWPVMQRALATYFERGRFRHPQPADFFAIVNEVSGRDMTWFFDQVYRGSNVFDYGVQELSSRLKPAPTTVHETSVVVRRYGEATFPVDVVTRFENGEEVRERWDGLDRRVIYTYERESRPVSAWVDPDRVLLLDVNYTNNSRTLAPRASDAGLKWGLKWMVWLQDLMLTYAFFV